MTRANTLAFLALTQIETSTLAHCELVVSLLRGAVENSSKYLGVG